MEIKDLRYFIAVYETNSFGRAAHSLSTTQSNVSAKIRKLENFIGAPLFERLHRKIAPTRKGSLLYRYARNVIASMDQAIEMIRDDKAA